MSPPKKKGDSESESGTSEKSTSSDTADTDTDNNDDWKSSNKQKNCKNLKDGQETSKMNENRNAKGSKLRGDNAKREPSVEQSSSSTEDSVREGIENTAISSDEKCDSSTTANEDDDQMGDNSSSSGSTTSSTTSSSSSSRQTETDVSPDEPINDESKKPHRRSRQNAGNDSDSNGELRCAPRKKQKLDPNIDPATGAKVSSLASEGDDEDDEARTNKGSSSSFEILYSTDGASQEFYRQEFYPLSTPKDSSSHKDGQNSVNLGTPGDHHLLVSTEKSNKLEEYAQKVSRFMRKCGKFDMSSVVDIIKFTHLTAKTMYWEDASIVAQLNENITPQKAYKYTNEGFVITHNGKCSTEDHTCAYYCHICKICSHEYSCTCRSENKNMMWCHHLHAAVRLGQGIFEGPIFAVFFKHTTRHFRGMTRFNIKNDVSAETPWVFKVRDVHIDLGHARVEKFYKPDRHFGNCMVCSESQRCALCQICRHHFGCTCKMYAKEKILCDHCHLAQKYYNKNKEDEQSTDNENSEDTGGSSNNGNNDDQASKNGQDDGNGEGNQRANNSDNDVEMMDTN